MLRTARLLVVFALALLLSACGKDPVVADLAAYDAAGKQAAQGMDAAAMNKQLSAARSNEERATLLGTIGDALAKRSEVLAKLDVKTPEGKSLLDKTLKGMRTSSEGAKAAQQALGNNDSAALLAASDKMTAGQMLLLEAGRDYVTLAKAKHFTPDQ